MHFVCMDAFIPCFTSTTFCGIIPQTQAFVLHEASSRLDVQISQGYTIMCNRGVISAEGTVQEEGEFFFFDRMERVYRWRRTFCPLSLTTNDPEFL
jgi:hypothetical protein